MDDLASKLGELLNNPGSLDQIKSIAGLLGGAASNTQPAAPQPEQNDSSIPGIDGELLHTIMKVAPLLSNFRQEDDNTRFLHALRPLLGEERQKKLDEAIKLMQMMRLLPLLKGSDLLGGLFGG
jgi:hypothetical protein